MSVLTHSTFDPSKVIVDPDVKEPKDATVGSKIPFKYQTNGKPSWITIKGPECTIRFKHELKHAVKLKMQKDKQYKPTEKDYEYVDDEKRIPKMCAMWSFDAVEPREPNSDDPKVLKAYQADLKKWQDQQAFIKKLNTTAANMEVDARPMYWKEVSGEESDEPLPDYKGITFVVPEDESQTVRAKSSIYAITDPNSDRYGQISGFLRLSRRQQGNSTTILQTPVTDPWELIGKQCICTPTMTIMDVYWSDKTHKARTKTIGAVIRRTEVPQGGIDYSDIIADYTADASLLQDEDELDNINDKFTDDDVPEDQETEPEPPKPAPKAAPKKASNPKVNAAPPKVAKPKAAVVKKPSSKPNVESLIDEN